MHWTGTTGADGVATGAGRAVPRAAFSGEDDYEEWHKFAFVVMAEKDGDVAYVGSDWNEGIEPWDFGTAFNLAEAEPLLRGTVFSDRGVYRLGEEVHFKAILRQNTPDGIRLLPRRHARLHHAPRQPGPHRRRAHGHDQRLEQRRVDDDAAAEGALGNYSRPRRCSRATSRSQDARGGRARDVPAPGSTTTCRIRRR